MTAIECFMCVVENGALTGAETSDIEGNNVKKELIHNRKTRLVGTCHES